MDLENRLEQQKEKLQALLNELRQINTRRETLSIQIFKIQGRIEELEEQLNDKQ